MVQVTVPAWMWGGRPQGFFEQAGLRADGVDGNYKVQTQERFLRRKHGFMFDNAVVIDHRGRRQHGYETVGRIADDKIDQRTVQRVIDMGLVPTEPVNTEHWALLSFLQVRAALVDSRELPAMCTHLHSELGDVRYSDDDERILPDVSVHYIFRSEAIVKRHSLLKVLLQAEHDPRLATDDTPDVEDRFTFASSSGLSDGLLIIDAYVEPLLAALSPGVWALPVQRLHGTLIASYGRTISGTAPVPNELLRTLHTVGTDVRTTFEAFKSPNAPASAISWWACRLDELFGVLLDPDTYAKADGSFDVTAAVQNLLSVEQVFRRTNSVLLAHHDTHARRALFFSIIDTLTSLTSKAQERMFNHTHAVGTLERLERSLPVEAQEILLPAARRGVDALRRVQDGFFLPETGGRIKLNEKRTVGVVEAAATYVAMLRDATHGFTTKKRAQRQQVATMVAVHDGKIDHDLGLLAWLYLLELLDDPERLRNHLMQSTRDQ